MKDSKVLVIILSLIHILAHAQLFCSVPTVEPYLRILIIFYHYLLCTVNPYFRCTEDHYLMCAVDPYLIGPYRIRNVDLYLRCTTFLRYSVYPQVNPPYLRCIVSSYR